MASFSVRVLMAVHVRCMHGLPVMFRPFVLLATPPVAYPMSIPGTVILSCADTPMLWAHRCTGSAGHRGLCSLPIPCALIAEGANRRGADEYCLEVVPQIKRGGGVEIHTPFLDVAILKVGGPALSRGPH